MRPAAKSRFACVIFLRVHSERSALHDRLTQRCAQEQCEAGRTGTAECGQKTVFVERFEAGTP